MSFRPRTFPLSFRPSAASGEIYIEPGSSAAISFQAANGAEPSNPTIAASHCPDRPSRKSPSTPDSANLMIISNIVNCPVLGGINLPPPHIEQIGILFIVSDFVNSPVLGDLHEGPGDKRNFPCHSAQRLPPCHSEGAFPLPFRPSANLREGAKRIEKSVLSVASVLLSPHFIVARGATRIAGGL